MTTTASTADPSTRFCPACLRDRPINEFRRRRQGGQAREGKCNLCHAEYMRGYRRRRRKRGLDRFASQCARAEGHEVVALCTIMFRRLGGVAGFAGAFKDALDSALEAAPGSRHACNMLMALMKMLETADAQRPPPDDLSRLSDDELQGRVQEEIAALICEQPQLAVIVAHQIGWTLIPPDDCNEMQDA